MLIKVHERILINIRDFTINVKAKAAKVPNSHSMKNLVKATILRYLVLYHINSLRSVFTHCIESFPQIRFTLQGYVKESELLLGYKS